MSDTMITLQATFPSDHKKDELIECIKLLRVLAQRYPQHLDIAYQALEREYNLPPMQQLATQDNVINGGSL